MKKMLLLLLALALLMSCLAPIAAADNATEGQPSRADMHGHGSIAVPKRESWLEHYETRYVCTSGGVAAYFFTAPRLYEQDLIFDQVYEGTELTLLAEENNFYLAKTEYGGLGWICVGMTAETRELLDSVPQLQDSCWILQMGEGKDNSYALKFGAKRIANVRIVSNGREDVWNWTLTSRRVWLDGRYYVWDGEQFVSRDLYDAPDGSRIRYTIRPDTEGQFDKLSA